MGKVIGIQNSVLTMVTAHFDPNDSARINGISDDQLRLFMERFNQAIMGICSGEVLPEYSFDIANPLIKCDPELNISNRD